MCECFEWAEGDKYYCEACAPLAEMAIEREPILETNAVVNYMRRQQLSKALFEVLGAIDDFYRTSESEYLSAASRKGWRVVEEGTQRAELMWRLIQEIRALYVRNFLLKAVEDWREEHRNDQEA